MSGEPFVIAIDDCTCDPGAIPRVDCPYCARAATTTATDDADDCEHWGGGFPGECSECWSCVLPALGVAIATVAHATLVARACDGRDVHGVRDMAAFYGRFGPGEWLVYFHPSHFPAVVKSPHPADAAAEVVEMLITKGAE